MTEAPEPAPSFEGIPHSIEAEQGLLGVVLFENERFHVIDDLEPRHFVEPIHGRFWAHISERIGHGLVAEPVEMAQAFRGDEAFAALGGLRYLADLIDNAPPFYMTQTHAGVIKEAFLRREVLFACEEIILEARSGVKEGADVLAAAETTIFSIGEKGGKGVGFSPLSTGLDDALELAAAAMDRDGGLSGLTTGLLDLDRQLGGLHPSDLVILAGRPSMGKTALATNIAHNAARAGAKVGFFSLEMSREQLAMRLLAEVSGISGDRIRKGLIDRAEYYRLREASTEIRDLPLEIDETGGLPIAKLSARARRLKRSRGLDLLVIDYLQLVTCPDMKGSNRVAEVSAITQALKALAKELHIPVLALSQLSRQVESREDKRPQLSDLRESGSIEQDADVVMFVYREAYYLGRAEPKEGSPEHLVWEDDMARARHRADCIVSKQRHGPIGTVGLAFHEELTRFGNLAREERFANHQTPPAERRVRYSALEDA